MNIEKQLGESTLSSNPKKKFIFKIRDGSVTKEKLSSDVLVASNISFNSNGTNLSSDNVQDALGELDNAHTIIADEIADIHDATNTIISVLVKNGFNIDLTSSKGWTFSYRSITQSSEDGTYKPFTTLSVDAKWYAQDITDKVYNVSWSRDSGNAEADEAWNKLHANSSLSLPITYDDLGGYSYVIGNTSFTCTAEYDADGEWQKAQKTVCF